MIKAVIWDFGGVLTSSPFEAFRRFEFDRGIPADFIRGVNAKNPDSNAWARFERAEIALEEFDALFEAESSSAGHAIKGSHVVALLGGELRPKMVRALELCASHYRVGCITNNVPAGRGSGTRLGEAGASLRRSQVAFDAQHAAAIKRVMALFHHVVESKRVGIRKPDPKIYLMACAALGVSPVDAVYLDDLGVNLKPARELGMTTIKVSDPDAALAELEQILGRKLL